MHPCVWGLLVHRRLCGIYASDEVTLAKAFFSVFFFLVWRSCSRNPWAALRTNSTAACLEKKWGITLAEVEQSCLAPPQAVVKRIELGRGRHRVVLGQLLHLPHPLCCASKQGGGQCWTSHQVFVCCWNCSKKILPSQDGAGAWVCIPCQEWVFWGLWVSLCSSGLVSGTIWYLAVIYFFFPSLWAFCLLINQGFFHCHLLVLISYWWNGILGTLK